ncbi:MAG: peptidoglycan DD-metalloendopeptidase family protein [Alphaproteobacteria bacterium]|nr:peptidoglycan DD-metalloendopeptidase family protein [Alphaproteobacteria bacterium]
MSLSPALKSLAVIKALHKFQQGVEHTRRVLVISLTVSGLPLVASAEGFDLPLNCQLGENCWVMNYPDHQPGPNVADSACGPRSYDGHTGTDFAIRDLKKMSRGVDVRAIAAGTVWRLRNDANDHGLTFSMSEVERKECGNGVVIRHADGWESQYCHLRRGSIYVDLDDKVLRGDTIGQIGMSGRTAFPHVHLSLRKDRQLVDPANGRGVGKGCGTKEKSLFRTETNFRYHRSRLYAAGFAASVPTGTKIKTDARTPKMIAVDAPALVFWAAIFGAAKGSRMHLIIKKPGGGKFIDKNISITRNQAWRMVYIGRKRKAGKRWPSGRYRGTAKLIFETNGGKSSQTQQISVDIP